MGERCHTEDYAGTFGVGVGCRLVQSGIDLDTLRFNSCFSVGNGRGIMVGVDGMRSFTLVGSTVGAVDEGSVRKAKSVGDGVGCRLVKVGINLDTASVGNSFSVRNRATITINERSMRNTRSVGDGVGCRLVKVGIDLDTLRFDSCFSVGDAKDITVGVDGGRSIPLVGSRVDAIDGSGDGKLVGCVAGVS